MQPARAHLHTMYEPLEGDVMDGDNIRTMQRERVSRAPGHGRGAPVIQRPAALPEAPAPGGGIKTMLLEFGILVVMAVVIVACLQPFRPKPKAQV